MNTLDDILRSRGEEYGNFAKHAQIAQAIKKQIEAHCKKEVKDYQKEALDMIVHKIGRITNGNPNNIDSWQDIAGYAQLVVKELQKELVQGCE